MTSIKKPTAIGIGRTLSNANIHKSVYRASRMVRGYGKVTNGYNIRSTANGLIVEYHINEFATIGLNDAQISEKREQANAELRAHLMQIETVLRGKGYNATVQFEMVKDVLKGSVVC